MERLPLVGTKGGCVQSLAGGCASTSRDAFGTGAIGNGTHNRTGTGDETVPWSTFPTNTRWAVGPRMWCGVFGNGGTTLKVVLPKGAAWRRLHAMRRVHTVQIAPNSGLPLGALLVSVYAPQQSHATEAERVQFAAAFLDFVHALDMQVPTLLLGDFNGTVFPARDYLGVSGARRSACPLLTRLLGPGAPWTDVQVAVLGETNLDFTYRNSDSSGRQAASRIDLVLANRAALLMVQGLQVITEIRDGGHSPVVVTLRPPAIRLCWQRPRPQLPDLLQNSSAELRSSTEWLELLNHWKAGWAAHGGLNNSCAGLDELSTALLASLEALVQISGGWVKRPPARQSAYESKEVRKLRRRLAVLHRLEADILRCPVVPGCWPCKWERWLAELQREGVNLLQESMTALRVGVQTAMKEGRQQLERCLRQMRAARQTRWRELIPQLWRDRPGTVCGWLRGDSAAWGSTPILDAHGNQCTTVEAVDAAVQSFWVESVLRRHAGVDGEAMLQALLQSEFGGHIPHVDWPEETWTISRVRRVMASMREDAAPGQLGIPLAIWKSLPEEWLAALARMLQLVEIEGRWPAAWTHAYVTMIPKASGGSRPEDQRPITVLDLAYRIWAKGVVQEWSPVLQTAYLGDAALGFRAQSGTTHVVQLLQDVIILQQRRGEELWLASFDIKKCYDSLPWWALFGVARQAGVREAVVRGFEAFYHQLQRRFRYGQVDGSVWQASNGAAQGCPASPDLLNLLFEAFHRWARAAGLGVIVGSTLIPSISYADDLALLARCQSEMESLVSAYLRWCALLGLEVTKVQLWWNGHEVRHLCVEELTAETQPFFTMVGVVLGTREVEATKLHVAKRLPKAISTAQRLQALDVPTSLAAHLWRAMVLPQVLYGCEVRNITPTQLQPLQTLGKALLAAKAPLKLNEWRAPEVLMGPPLGESALRDPVWEMRLRQLRWLQLVSNLPSLVGVVHREVACMTDTWEEASSALQAALKAVGWRMLRNVKCLRSAAWPYLLPEERYGGEIRLEPVDDFPEAGQCSPMGPCWSRRVARQLCCLTRRRFCSYGFWHREVAHIVNW